MNPLTPPRHWLRRTLGVLVQADKPVLPRSDAEITADVERNYRWNFGANLLDGMFFWFGLSFISASTIIPLFVSKLTSSALLIGAVAVIAQGAWFLPQLFTANWTERLPRMKPIVINLGFFLERLPVWFLVVAALLGGQSPGLALLLFFFAYSWRGLGSGAVAPAWQDLVARCFPVNRRGRVFGIINLLGTAAAAAGAALSTWLLQFFAFPLNFACIFAIAGAATCASWFSLSLTREPEQPPNHDTQDVRTFLAELPGIVRHDQNFRRFLVARSLIALGSLGAGFVTVAAVQRWQVSDATVGLYTAAYWLGQTAGYPVFGFMADRFGHKLSLELGTLASALAFGLAWLAPSPEWILAVFVLMGVNVSSILGSGILVALEFSEPKRRPTYVGITNTTAGLVSMVAPMLGAWLAGLGYAWIFAASAIVNLAAVAAMRWWVREPRWAAVLPTPTLERES